MKWAERMEEPLDVPASVSDSLPRYISCRGLTSIEAEEAIASSHFLISALEASKPNGGIAGVGGGESERKTAS